MIRRPPRSTPLYSSAASDVYKRQGFNDVNTAGWMWGVDITSDIGIGLDSWWGQMDYFSYSYAGYGDYKAIDSGLYAQIPDGDVRKNQFYQNSGSASYLQPWFKFFDESR